MGPGTKGLAYFSHSSYAYPPPPSHMVSVWNYIVFMEIGRVNLRKYLIQMNFTADY